MDEIKALPQAKPLENQIDNMSKKEALDILLRNVAESKKQIARGQYYTHEEVCAMLAAKRKIRDTKQ